MEHEYLITKDGLTIAGDYYQGQSKSAVLLLHMMPANRTSWQVLARKLQGEHFHVFAIDLRGHGESTGGPFGFQLFSNAEHQQSMFDIESSIEFLHGKGIEKVHIGGASMGANLALQYAAQHPEVVSIMLLSPGLDYKGIHTDIWIDSIKPNQAVLLVASDDDIYSFTSVKTLFEHSSHLPKREIKLLTQAGHGTEMFEKTPAFVDELIAWFQKIDLQESVVTSS